VHIWTSITLTRRRIWRTLKHRNDLSLSALSQSRSPSSVLSYHPASPRFRVKHNEEKSTEWSSSNSSFYSYLFSFVQWRILLSLLLTSISHHDHKISEHTSRKERKKCCSFSVREPFRKKSVDGREKRFWLISLASSFYEKMLTYRR